MLAALLLAATVAGAAPSPPPPSAPSCVPDAEVDAHIDPRLPPWMRVEIRAVMLSLPPCNRGGHQGSTDSQGRFITNDYDDYVASVREFGGRWQRADPQHWRTPSGELLDMPDVPPPAWLLGRWTCTRTDGPGLELLFREDATGMEHTLTTTGGVDPQGRFVQFPSPPQPIELYSYQQRRLPTIYTASGHSGTAYGVMRTVAGLRLWNWGYYRQGEWPVLTMQPEWPCARSAQR